MNGVSWYKGVPKVKHIRTRNYSEIGRGILKETGTLLIETLINLFIPSNSVLKSPYYIEGYGSESGQPLSSSEIPRPVPPIPTPPSPPSPPSPPPSV